MPTIKLANHKEKVKKIAKQISATSGNPRKLRIFHGFSHTTREVTHDKDNIIDISELNGVLEINNELKYALVEPNVTMGKLVEQTLQRGLVPLVVPELPKITVGGAIQGAAGESSSFKYGAVHNICDEYEVVLGNGDIVIASSIVNSELYWGIPGSYGTLAVTTLAKMRLVEAKKYVKLLYFPVNSFSELLATIEMHTEENIDFIDAILFGASRGIVMVGLMVNYLDTEKGAIHFSNKTDDWFYLYVLNKIKKHDFAADYIPLEDYLFRYNQGAFWTGKFVFDKLKIPFTKLTRRLLYKYLNAESLGKAVHLANNSQFGICQDFCLPNSQLVGFLNYLDQTLQAYPLWLCPLKVSQVGDKFSPNNIVGHKVTNVGIYAKFSKSYQGFINMNKNLEKKLAQLKGRKVLYAHQYYSPEEFWKIYDLGWYEALRKKYLASDAFPNIYEKTHVNKRYKTKRFKTALNFLASLVSNFML